jgi:hypothetical protein
MLIPIEYLKLMYPKFIAITIISLPVLAIILWLTLAQLMGWNHNQNHTIMELPRPMKIETPNAGAYPIDPSYQSLAPEPTSPNSESTQEDAQAAARDWIMMKESSGNPSAINPTSGACGLFQAYPCSKMQCPLNESGLECQFEWADNYVKGRYGSWTAAKSFWQRNGWY